MKVKINRDGSMTITLESGEIIEAVENPWEILKLAYELEKRGE